MHAGHQLLEVKRVCSAGRFLCYALNSKAREMYAPRKTRLLETFLHTHHTCTCCMSYCVNLLALAKSFAHVSSFKVFAAYCMSESQPGSEAFQGELVQRKNFFFIAQNQH